jgi:hypothetical protein
VYCLSAAAGAGLYVYYLSAAAGADLYVYYLCIAAGAGLYVYCLSAAAVTVLYALLSQHLVANLCNCFAFGLERCFHLFQQLHPQQVQVPASSVQHIPWSTCHRAGLRQGAPHHTAQGGRYSNA